MKVDRKIIEQLIFKQFENNPRFTQDSPVYPDVWMDYFEHIDTLGQYRQDLILTPHRKSSAAELLKTLLETIGERKNTNELEIASNGDTVVVKLTFEEMLFHVLPFTNWWQNYLFAENEPTDDLLWLERLVGALQHANNPRNGIDSASEQEALFLFQEIGRSYLSDRLGIRSERNYFIPKLWAISRNRQASINVELSVPATKADAGRRLFEIDGSDITWAVLDTGIDIRHKAFRAKDPQTKAFYTDPLGGRLDPRSNHTRILATYDFTKFRALLAQTLATPSTSLSLALQNLVESTGGKFDEQLTNIEVNDSINEIFIALKRGRLLDWSVIAPLLRIPHNSEDYKGPSHKHGTHVAGIIGAGMDTHETGRKLIGMCPGIHLYDIRVLNEKGVGDEFNILAAIQFVRWMNSQKDGIVIHGINLSLSMKHEVASYACGSTPVCEACERLVAEGTVVVASAGNQGQALFKSKEFGEVEGFRTVNITDPGNAEHVITVGSTHRNRPHSYGVSYFSSKGPTGDGRMKPDLVAPGEKIVSTGFNDQTERMDGTSMAAPHVSGGAALLMAKHRELIGRPKKIKDILCKTATDLGREKYFQGCGMLDVLRAIQSV